MKQFAFKQQVKEAQQYLAKKVYGSDEQPQVKEIDDNTVVLRFTEENCEWVVSTVIGKRKKNHKADITLDSFNDDMLEDVTIHMFNLG